jgi:Flp pilus assembly protein TadD
MSAPEEIRVAISAFRANRFSEAEVLCRLALHKAPYAVDALYILGRIHSDRGDDSEAARLFEQAQFAAPKFVAPYAHLFEHYYTRGRLGGPKRSWSAAPSGSIDWKECSTTLLGQIHRGTLQSLRADV